MAMLESFALTRRRVGAKVLIASVTVTLEQVSRQ